LYHNEQAGSIGEVLKHEHPCVICGGTGIVAGISEIAFSECAVWCKCDAGQKLFGRVIEVMGKCEPEGRVKAA
jgi:hypothetical protein